MHTIQYVVTYTCSLLLTHWPAALSYTDTVQSGTTSAKIFDPDSADQLRTATAHCSVSCGYTPRNENNSVQLITSYK